MATKAPAIPAGSKKRWNQKAFNNTGNSITNANA